MDEGETDGVRVGEDAVTESDGVRVGVSEG